MGFEFELCLPNRPGQKWRSLAVGLVVLRLAALPLDSERAAPAARLGELADEVVLVDGDVVRPDLCPRASRFDATPLWHLVIEGAGLKSVGRS